jgi:predicted DNA-binding protein (UPF0251 family)
MSRPPCCRRVSGKPGASLYQPAGIPARVLEEILMTLDELESIRLADLEGLYQEQAAERMEVSRATFGRILETAHRKIAGALIQGKALRIEGGHVLPERPGPFRCPRCSVEWEGRRACPRCRTGPGSGRANGGRRRRRSNPEKTRGG